MAKYNELLKDYASDIAQVKKLKAKADQLKEIADNHDKSFVDWYDEKAMFEHQDKSMNLYGAWAEAYDDYIIALNKLTQDIEIEYHDVPYSKPRRQGIEKFWELSGIEK